MTGRPAVLKESLPIVLRDPEVDFPAYRGTVLTKLGKLSDPWVADAVLAHYPKFTPDEQSKSVELLDAATGVGQVAFHSDRRQEDQQGCHQRQPGPPTLGVRRTPS